jgi:pseudouridine synthase
MTERLNRLLSHAGVGSRRKVEALLGEGVVTVNGQVVREPWKAVDPDADEVCVRGDRVRLLPEPVYVMVHKPRGMITSTKDPEGRRTVLQLLDDPELEGVRLFPVGRLDWASEGLVLLTNDGELTHRLTHPSHGVEKVYLAKVRNQPDEPTLERLRRGVKLEDGPARASRVRVVDRTERNAWLEIVVAEGRNRVVRRLLQRVGHPVMRLKRIAYGPLLLGDLDNAQWRVLVKREVRALRQVVGLGMRGR